MRRTLAFKLYHKWDKMSGGRAMLHALGFMKYPEVLSLPLRFTDSTAWLNGSLYGSMTWFDPMTGFTEFSVREYVRRKRLGKDSQRMEMEMQRKALYMASCGISPERVMDHQLYRGTLAFPGMSTIHQYIKMADYVERAHNLTYFFSASGLEQIYRLLSVFFNCDGEKFDYHAACKMYKNFRSLLPIESAYIINDLIKKKEAEVEA